jgi:hypothetical protein
MGDGAFAAGLLFPAIPLIINKRIGIEMVRKYLSEINR